MEQPDGYADRRKRNWVWHLTKRLYELVQARRIWNEELISHGRFPVTLKDPAVYIKSARSSLLGDPGGSILFRWVLGRHSTCFRKISTRSMAPLVETFFPCTSRTYSQFNARLSDPNRKSSRRARANRHVGGTRTSTLGPSGIEPPLKRKIPVTRDDTDEFMLWGSPGCVGFRGGTTLVVAFYYPQTVSIAYYGSRILVTNV